MERRLTNGEIDFLSKSVMIFIRIYGHWIPDRIVRREYPEPWKGLSGIQIQKKWIKF